MTLSASKCPTLSCALYSFIVKPAMKKHVSEKADATGMQGILKQVASNG